MGTVSLTLPSDGDTIDAADVNTPLNAIAAVINGSISDVNLATGAVTTAKIADDAVTAAKMQYGMIRQRQGGAAGDASWFTQGTTNVDTSAKAVFIQVGSVSSPSATTKTVTFPVAFTQVPLIFLTVNNASGANQVRAYARDATTTQFTLGNLDAGTEECAWLAIGQ